MRNIFDQYSQPENRLTHALVCALDAEPKLLSNFVKWVTGHRPPKQRLTIVEQNLPGEEEASDKDEASRRGLPDAWIHDGDTWSVIIESKIESRLDADQLERHRRTAHRRGFFDSHLVAFVAEEPRGIFADVTVSRWTDLYCWLMQQRGSDWARRVAQFMEVSEEKLVADGYLKSGTLTVFAGVPFGKDTPYNYYEAKRILRLAMDELRVRQDLRKELRIDSADNGRPAITGAASNSVWDILRLNGASNGSRFTESPHLTVSLQRDRLLAILIVPNGVRSEIRRNLLAGGHERFKDVLSECLKQFRRSLGAVEGATPWLEVVQRRYSARKAEPIRDAHLEFDLRTAILDGGRRGIKLQPEWLDAAYNAIAKKHSNLQLAFGGAFPYDRCPAVRTPGLLDHIAQAWLSCKPFVKAVTSLRSNSR